MRILVTGAGGFIGSFTSEELLRRGHTVIGLDSFDDYYDPAVKRRNLADALAHPAFHIVEGDFREPRLVEWVFDEHRPRGVIHLGARAGVRPSLENAPLYVDVNLVGSTVLLDASRRHEIEKFVFASSSSVYGKRPTEPFREEDDADRPVSPYAATKRAGELICHTYHHLYGLPITCLRFFTVYGPRQRPEMAIHHFTRAIARGEPIRVFGDGSAQRDFTYVHDVVSGVCAAFERCAGYRIYNLGNSRTVELREVIALIEEALGVRAKIEHLPEEPGDVPVTFADISRARAELGYDPKVPIQEGIACFVEWFRGEEKRNALRRAERAP